MQLLTSAEAAAYLRLKERKLYELVAEHAIPCTKITGRWLFPRAKLDQWIASSLVQPAGMPDFEPPPIVGGSHDPLLEWSLRESGCGLASLPEGSTTGLERLTAGKVVAAAIHLHALESETADANVETLRSRNDLHNAVLAGFLRREQGLLVAAGNPKNIGSIEDAVVKRARIATRPDGAGAQLILLTLLHRASLPLDKLLLVRPPCPTGPDVAQAIRAGHADCGISTRSVANATGLDFIPLLWEQFDIAMRSRDYFRPPLQALLTFFRTSAFTARARELGGYDISGVGTIRYAR